MTLRATRRYRLANYAWLYLNLKLMVIYRSRTSRVVLDVCTGQRARLHPSSSLIFYTLYTQYLIGKPGPSHKLPGS